MREKGGDTTRIVLIGEEDGPIRNALDASEFAVDRFVGRPLIAKALVFAVECSAKDALEERNGVGERNGEKADQGGALRGTNMRGDLDKMVDGIMDEYVQQAIGKLDDVRGPTVAWPSVDIRNDKSGVARTPGDALQFVQGVPFRLEDTDIATLLGELSRIEFTGRVTFRRPPAQKAIQFDRGKTVFACSNLPHDRMGDLLFREGKITREQHASSRVLVVESGRRMGETLVEMGFLKPRELGAVVRRHVEEIIFSLFAWDTGEFTVESGRESNAEKIRLSRSTVAIVFEGVRRKYSAARLRKQVPGNAGVRVADSVLFATVPRVADLTGGECQALEQMRLGATISESSEQAGVSMLAALQLAYCVVAIGAGRLVRGGEDAVKAKMSLDTEITIDRQRILAKHALVMEADYFRLLGVRRDATAFEVLRAYEIACQEYSPDAFTSELQEEFQHELSEIREVLTEAYNVLRHDPLRTSYAANLYD